MNEEKFTGKADFYSKYRPSYPDALIDWLFDKTKAQSVADIGAGTGIFTKCLLKKPWNITAVEPNSDMLAEFHKTVGAIVPTVQASAESTGLADGAFDLIAVAQAFHWFDKYRFKEECIRLLTHRGKLAVVWNERCQNNFAAERNAVCMKYCNSYHSGHVFTGYQDFDGDKFLRNEYFAQTEYFSSENPVFMTREHFIGDNLSRSYALKPDDGKYEDFIKELNDVFDRYNENGLVRQLYLTTCFLGSF